MIIKNTPGWPLLKILGLSLLALLALLLAGWWQRNFILRHLLSQPVTVLPQKHFFSQATKFRLATPMQGDIYYTLDGSVPTTDSNLYQQAFELDDSAIIKFAVFLNDKPLTKTQSHDVFINTQHDLPVISLSIDPQHLWSEATGIYILGENDNYTKRGSKWERPALMRWYNPNHSAGFTQTVGVRIHGAAQRSMAQKSFRIYVQDEQGQDSKLTYPLFGDRGNSEHYSFILRNGSSDAQYAMMRDRLASELVYQANMEADSNLEYQASRPVVVYINGQYWGLYFLRERFDETYFAQKYQVNPEALAIVEVPLIDGEQKGQAIPTDYGEKSNARAYNRLLADVARCEDCASYAHVKNQADVNNLRDYLLFEMFFANFDWPFNNLKAWHYENPVPNSPEANLVEELDGRWRWLLFDLDVGFGAGQATSSAMIKAAQGDPYAAFVDPVFPFRNFFYNPVFQKKWEDRVDELTQSVLSSENMIQTIDRLQQEVASEMPRHVERWGGVPGDSQLITVASREEWQQRIDLLKDFVEQRPAAFKKLTTQFLQKH